MVLTRVFTLGFSSLAATWWIGYPIDMEELSTSKVFQQFYAKLVKTLPMDDAIFIAELFSRGLLPDDVKDHIEHLATPAKKASYFLDHVIRPSVTCKVGRSFDDLLCVMKDSEYQSVNELARLIRTSLNKGGKIDGSYQCKYYCIWLP